MSQGDIQFSETQRGNSGGEQQTHNSKRLATQFFMANAPPGKLREVMEKDHKRQSPSSSNQTTSSIIISNPEPWDCELLVDPAAVSDRFMQETLEQAAEDRRQFVSVSSPGAAPYEALLCSAASFGKSQYLHPPTKSLLTVAARASDLVVTSSVPAPPEAFPPALEQHRLAFERELESHVQRRCGQGSLLRARVSPEIHRGSFVFSHQRKDKTPMPQLTAVISSLTDNKSSSWACSWSSEWRVFFSLSDASSLVYIEGEMEVRAFLYEDSSIQASFSRVFRVEDKNPFISSSSTEDKTNTSVNKGEKGEKREKREKNECSNHLNLVVANASLDSPEKFARQLIQIIRNKEEIVFHEINDFFTQRALKTAKSLRRVLPVYAKPFDWKQQSIQLQPQQLSVE